MKTSRFLVVLLCIALMNCSKDETPTAKPDDEENSNPEPEEPQESLTEVYFTLNTFTNSSDVSWANLDQWVIIHDSNGKLLDYSEYESGDKLEFEALKDSLTPTINITYLRFTEDSNNQINQEIRTEAGIIKGTIETFGPYQSVTSSLEKEGEFRVRINNIPNPNNAAYPLKVELSSGIGRLGSSGSGSADASGINLNLNMDKYENINDYFMSVLDHTNTLKYHYFEQTSLEEYTSDYQTDFKVIEKDISFALPPHSNYYLNISGYKENQEFNQYGGYWIHEVIPQLNDDISTSPLRIGYASIFPKYRTIFSILMDGYSYVNAHYGKSLDAIVIPNKPLFTTSNTSINMFRFDVDIDYLSAKHTWNYVENQNQYFRTDWTILAEKGNEPNIGNLPVEILEKYPSLNIDLMEYKSTTFNLPLREDAEFLSIHTLRVFNE